MGRGVGVGLVERLDKKRGDFLRIVYQLVYIEKK